MKVEDNRYAISVAVAKRARQITNDALIHAELLEHNPVDTASKEYEKGEFKIVYS
jgi:DNA-directed RNA polymerase subunit K/omega